MQTEIFEGSNVFKWALWCLKNKGLKGFFSFVFSTLADYTFDYKYGTQTRKRVDCDELETSSSNKDSASRYQATKERPFRKLMEVIELPQGSVFVDVGCGKGKVLLMASQYGFDRVVGIEFSPPLCEIARQNIETFKKNRKSETKIEVYEGDVLEYPFQHDENVWFLYNPFDGSVLGEFYKNLRRELEEYPREIYFIYHISEHKDQIEADGYLTKVADHLLGGTYFSVYSNRSALKEEESRDHATAVDT